MIGAKPTNDDHHFPMEFPASTVSAIEKQGKTQRWSARDLHAGHQRHAIETLTVHT